MQAAGKAGNKNVSHETFGFAASGNHIVCSHGEMEKRAVGEVRAELAGFCCCNNLLPFAGTCSGDRISNDCL